MIINKTMLGVKKKKSVQQICQKMLKNKRPSSEEMRAKHTAMPADRLSA